MEPTRHLSNRILLPEELECAMVKIRSAISTLRPESTLDDLLYALTQIQKALPDDQRL